MMKDVRRRRPGSLNSPDDLPYVPIFVTALFLLLFVGFAGFVGRPLTIASTATGPSLKLAPSKLIIHPQRQSARAAVPAAVRQTLLDSPPDMSVEAAPKPSLMTTREVVPPAVPPAEVSVPVAVSSFSQADVQVGNTGGDGVFLRHTPILADRWIAWPDHTHLTLLGEMADTGGLHWYQVRDPKQNVGWVPSNYVIQ